MAPKVSDEYKTKKKIELLQAAKRVFITKGYTRATMQDVMNEAGVSRGALYAYFDNLEHLYLELLQFEDQQDVQFFTPIAGELSWQQVTKWVSKQQVEIEKIEQTLSQANSEFFLSLRDQQKQQSYPYITTRYEKMVDVLTAFFAHGTATGEFKLQLPPEAIARYLISVIDGLMLDTAHLGAEKTKVSEQMEALLFSLRAMLGPVQ
ncbi:TetR family transcriptional regulator [Brevibacillus porteri]|uniref:TetR/AcrR family transcriptional regulator n=1 Tax=Brevibacillus porteri TaxID=2126350 RepID=A0ABX5FU96_9BACL|nr:TetR family transcriptional regulator [Brevibacillus porteri]MED1797460.1 TetR family transcriptional regulator [Brevibacillus porteri]MED2129530.1 TetR family transcriptional regulator [Brevibacillus porteri]MED2743631.1 TetR family transcriptional regulator [Brevibacillus porteri]MED2815189.1 TetR family transcriptional regulator [Brevibacillus porteri]MED2897188.1 TetR family transcriptional regulator [Brevibacillus porteri]